MKSALPAVAALTLCAACPTPGAGVATQAPDQTSGLVFGRIPSLRGEVADAEVRPLINYLSKALGTPINLVEAPTYREMIRMLAAHRVDIAYLGGIGFSRAEPSGYVPAVVLQRHGSRTQRGLIFTRTDTGLKELKDVMGHKIAFVEEGSTTGWACPMATLYAAGIKPKDVSYAFLGGHDAVVRAVLVDKTYDVGACYETAIEAALPGRADLVKTAHVLAHTVAVPAGVIAVWKDSARMKEIVGALRLVNSQPDAAAILTPFQAEAFVEPDPADFEAARSVDLLIAELTGE